MLEVEKKHLLLTCNYDNTSANLSGLVKVKLKIREIFETVLTLYFNFKIMTLANLIIYFKIFILMGQHFFLHVMLSFQAYDSKQNFI